MRSEHITETWYVISDGADWARRAVVSYLKATAEEREHAELVQETKSGALAVLNDPGRRFLDGKRIYTVTIDVRGGDE